VTLIPFYLIAERLERVTKTIANYATLFWNIYRTIALADGRLTDVDGLNRPDENVQIIAYATVLGPTPRIFEF